MSNNHVIKWKSKVNGRTGRGTKLFEKEEARRLAEELNHEYPEIEHEAVEAESESATATSGPSAQRVMAAMTGDWKNG